MRIALLQMTSGTDPQANGRAIVDAIAEAKRGGAAMLFTPEMSGMVDGDRARSRPKLQLEADDPVLAAVRAAAAQHGIWVHIGSLALLSGDDDGRAVNRGFVIDDNGEIRARYDKLHLFDVDLETGESWRESNAYRPGAGSAVVDTPIGQLGLAICYDLRFPQLFNALSGAGATVLALPAAFTVPTGQAHWHVLLRARAIENACWLIAAAQSGTHEDGRATYGHSLVIDPWGETVLDMGEGSGLAFAEIDLARTGEVRKRVPVIAHRRAIPDVVLS